MSAFAADWLALREPADHRARNREVLRELRAAFADRESVTVVDLGCGAGSNLRAVFTHLPPRQAWRLVDHDAALLAAARERLVAWADRVEASGDELILSKDERNVIVAFDKIDLAADLEAALRGPADLVTAAALFDLVSAPWIERFAGLVGERRAAFYAALVDNGTHAWHPPHPGDAEVLAAFRGHQVSDKGFGPAAGPESAGTLAGRFNALGYQVRTGASPWLLDNGDATLIREIAEAMAVAVRETRDVPEAGVRAWLEARLNGATCQVGHVDILATPT